MRQKGFVGIFVLVLVLVIAVAGGAYYLGRVSTKLQPTAKTQQSAQITPSPDPTVNWKTYVSTQFGYSIKYPPTLFPTKEPTKERRFEFTSFRFLTDANLAAKDLLEISNSDLEKSGYYINIQETSPNVSGVYGSFDNFLSELDRIETTRKHQKIVFAGLPAIKSTKLPFQGGTEGQRVDIMKGNTLLTISIQCGGENSFNECERRFPGLLSTFDQMLATFQFTPQ